MLLEFYEKRKLRRIIYSKTAVVFSIVVFALLVFPTWSAYSKMRVSAEKKTEVEREVAALRGRMELLESEIQRLSTPEGIEEELRKKFDVGREGEEIYVLIEGGAQQAQ